MLVPGVLAVLAPVVLLCVLPLRAACEEGEVWLPYHSLAIGGGGFTTGIVPTPRSASGTSTVFTRTDVGGVYRLGEDKDTWMPLVDQLTYRDRNRYGGDAIAVSWTNASRVWVSLGAYFDEPGPVLILASESAGDGWRPISPPGWSVRGGANNSTLRSLGERLAVHPKDERILIYGSYLNGLWRTSDADQPAPKWGKVALFPAGPFGALAVAFDPSSPRGDTVYASVPTKSVFVSTDAGVTWRSLATAGTAPAFANRLALALAYAPGPRSTAVVATESGSPVFASAADGVYRYNGTVWEKMRLPQGDVEITGIDVNPFDHLDVIAISNKAEGIARTLNGGESWENAMPEYRQVYELPWWDDSFRHNATVVNFTFGMCGNVRFSTAPMADPARTPAVYLADSWNVWRSDDFGKVKIATLRQMPHGHEEVFVLSMAAPHTTRPSLVTGTADLAGLVHDGPDWNAYPNFTFFGFGAWGAEGTGVAYTEDVLRLDAETTVPRSIVVAQARVFLTWA